MFRLKRLLLVNLDVCGREYRKNAQKIRNTQHATIKLEIAGHTDAMGDNAFNLQLSQARAESVVNYLAIKGADKTLLSAKGYGESQPIADNATPVGRTQNRRVELNRMAE